MRFRKTVDLWDSGNITRLLDGSLRLQTGQWVRCGSDKLSRFVRMLPCGTIHAAHWNGSGAARQSRFDDLRGLCVLPHIDRIQSAVDSVMVTTH